MKKLETSIQLKICRRYYLVLVIISVTLLCKVNSQNIKREIGTLDGKNNITENVVNSLCKDSLGFLWIGKMDGLYKYDGYKARVYSASSSSSEGISHPWVTSIAEYRSGLIIGTKNGINLFDKREERFTYLFPSEHNREFSNDISAIGTYSDNIILIGTVKGLLRYDINNSDTVRLKKITLKLADESFVEGKIESFTNHSDKVLINTDKGIFILSQNSDVANQLSFLVDGKPISNFRTVYITKDNSLFLATNDSLFKVDLNNNPIYRTEVFVATLVQNSYKNWPISKAINVICEDSESIIWFGTEGDGLYEYNPKTDEWQSHKHHINSKNVLKNDFIRTLYEAEPGLLFVGSDAGLNTVYTEKQRFQLIDSFKTGDSNIGVTNVHSVYKDHNERLWIGTRGKGLFVKYDESLINIAPKSNSALGQIRSIIEDRNDSIWVGTEKGIYIFDSNRVEPLTVNKKFNSAKADILPNEYVYAIQEDAVGNKWISTATGLSVYTVDGKIVNVTDSRSNSIFNDRLIYSLFLDSKNRMWFGTLNGTIAFLEYTDYNDSDVFERNLGKSLNFQQIEVATEHRKTFVNFGIYAFSELSNNDILVGTNFGICRINEPNKTIAPLFLNQEAENPSKLIHSYIYGLLYSEPDNTLWAATNNGLFSYQLELKEIKNYGLKDGLQSLEFNGNATFKDTDGKLYFGGSNGINIYDPSDNYTKSTIEPNIVLTNILINGKAINEIKDSNLIKGGISHRQNIVLKAKQNTIGFEFASLNLSHSSSNNFKCKLVGVDDSWIYLQNKNAINYANLPKGSYRFLLMGTNNEGVWSDSIVDLALEVLPPWYDTWYMWGLYAVLSMAILGSFIRILIKNRDKNNILKIKEIEQHNLESLYESKLVFFTNLSHELRTPLSLILDPIKTLINQKEIYTLNKDLFNILNSNADRLKKLIDQIMDFRKHENGQISIKMEQSDMRETLKSIAASFAFRSEIKNITLKMNLPEMPITMFYDEDKIEKIVYNLLSNAFKATASRGEIKLSLKNLDRKRISKLKKYTVVCGEKELKNLDNHIFIKISDNGVGIDTSIFDKIFTRFYQDHTINSGTGIGLYMVKQLTELHYGTILLKSKKGKGTSFIIILPKNNDLHESTSTLKIKKHIENLKRTEKIDLFKENIIDSIRQKSHSVVIVEDNDELRLYLKNILQEFYKIYTANNGFEGLQLIKEEIPDLIISDIVMPEIDGLTLCQKIKSNFDTSHVPIILLTAKSFDNQKIEGIKSGADAYITKPFNSQVLLARIENLIRGREKLRLTFQNNNLLEPSKVTVSSMDEKLLIKLKEYIEANMKNADLTLELLATEIGVSRAQLFRKMKALTGLTPNNFIKTLRLKQAIQLLKEDKFQVSEIAYLVGFKEPSYFSRCFKETYGCSPKEFLKSEHV